MCAKPISADEAGKAAAGAAPAWIQVCALDRLKQHSIICARAGEVALVLIWHEDRVIACERTCPHEQADLSLGHVSDGRLVCPHHAASFDLVDGHISSGWASRPLRIYPACVDQGEVRVQIDAAQAQVPSSLPPPNNA